VSRRRSRGSNKHTSSTHPLIGSNAAFSQPKPKAGICMINLNSFNQTLEGSKRPSNVKKLNSTVIQQLVPLVG
jgi:hypothetical protein